MLTSKPVKYAVQYPDRVIYVPTLAEARQMLKTRPDGKIYRVKHTKIK